MTTVHIRTLGTRTHLEASIVEAALRDTEGVEDVASISSIGLTSVLFDESRADERAIVLAIRSAGFEAAPFGH